MLLDRFRNLGPAWLSFVALLSLAPAAARAAEAPRAAAQTKGDEIDADMLRDLDLLNNANYARDREIAKRMTLFERLRVLQGPASASNQPQPPGPTPPAGAAKGR